MVRFLLRRASVPVLVAVSSIACNQSLSGTGNEGSHGDAAVARPDGGGSSPDNNNNDDEEFEPPTDAAVCVSLSVQAESAKLPVDIIWAVDTSWSMVFEATTVEEKLNAFAAQIDSWDIDYRVVMVAEADDGSFNSVCVPPPLGGSSCADGPLYRHIDERVGSHTALADLIDTYPLYREFLREDSLKHFVVVSDDEALSYKNDTWFRTQLARCTAPGFPEREYAPNGFVLHSIVAWGDVPEVGCETGANIGQSYLNLTELTGGVKAKVCETDWDPIFDALQTAVMAGTEMPCNFVIPESPTMEPVDPDQVNVVYTPGEGDPVTLPRVDSPDLCDGDLGWYYDNPREPTEVIVCDSTCDMLTGASAGRVDLEFGCATIVD